MVKQFGLRALNTFQPTPCRHTYQHQTKAEVKSQIDYILIRGRRADSLAKCTQTLIDTDLGACLFWPLRQPSASTLRTPQSGKMRPGESMLELSRGPFSLGMSRRFRRQCRSGCSTCANGTLSNPPGRDASKTDHQC